MTEMDGSTYGAAGLAEGTVLQILKVADLLTRIGNSHVFGKELTQAQFNVLMVLKRHGERGMSQKDILGYLVSTKGNVSIHITNLSRRGYVRKRPSKADSRMNVVSLTAKGKKILAEVEPRYMQHLHELTGELPVQSAEAATELLAYLHDRCSRILSETRDPRQKENG